MVVLFTAIVLVVTIGATASLAMGGRQSSANEAAAYQSVLAAESGQNAFMIRARKVLPYGGAIPASCPSGNDQVRALCGVNAWLSRVVNSQNVGSFPVSNSGSVTLSATGVQVDPTTRYLVNVDIEARGSASRSQGRVLQRYTALKASLGMPNIPGAVSSFPTVSMQGTSQITGGTLANTSNDGIYNNLLTVERMSTAPLSVGTPMVVSVPDVSQQRATQLRVGTYLQLPLTATTKGTFKVTANEGTTLTLQPVDLGGLALPVLPEGTMNVDYVMNGVVSLMGNALTVQATETFVRGDQVSVLVGGTPYTATVDSVADNIAVGSAGKTLNLTGWSPSAPPVSPGVREGSPARKSTNAVVTAGNFNECSNCTHTGDVKTGADGAALLPNPINDSLFIKTFGMTPHDMKNISNVVVDGAFSGPNRGLTWVTNAAGTSGGDINLNNEKITGKGIMVVDGNLTLNQNSDSACAFSGVLYVRGNLRIQGNLQACGAIVVEGSILSSTGTVMGTSNEDSFFSGNGRKIVYSPDAIMDAVAEAGPYVFRQQAGTWRQR